MKNKYIILCFSLILFGLISFFEYYIFQIYENGIIKEFFTLLSLGNILGGLEILTKYIRKFLNYNFINLLQ